MEKTIYIYIYIDHPKLHKHFGHFGNPISGEREGVREKEGKEREEGEREREQRERQRRERGLLFLQVVQFLVPFLVQFLVLYFQFPRAIFWCDCYRDISPPPQKKRRKKNKQHLCQSVPFVLIAVSWLFQNKSKSIEITTSHYVSGQFFNSAVYVSCGGRCMWSLEHFSHYKAGTFGKRCLMFGHFSRATSGGVSCGYCYNRRPPRSNQCSIDWGVREVFNLIPHYDSL